MSSGSGNLTGMGLVDPRSEFDIVADEPDVPSTNTPTKGKENSKISSQSKSKD